MHHLHATQPRHSTAADVTFTDLTHCMYLSRTSCTWSFSSLSCSKTSDSCSISFSFACRDLTSSAAFLSALARLESFSCRNLLKRMSDSCNSRSFFLRDSSRFLKASSWVAWQQVDSSGSLAEVGNAAAPRQSLQAMQSWSARAQRSTKV